MKQQIDKVLQEREILRKYRSLYQAIAPNIKGEELNTLKKALHFMLKAAQNLPSEQGCTLVLRNLELAKIVVERFGLGVPSISCILLYGLVEATVIPIQEVEQIFGHEITCLVESMLSIEKLPNLKLPIQAKKLKSSIIDLAKDGRIILIKLAICLHDMYRISYLPYKYQQLVLQQVKHVYAPLAHQLGLYQIRTELEDAYLKFTEPAVYHNIHEQIKFDERSQGQFFQFFSAPIEKALKEYGYVFVLKSRVKGIFSIWNKMQTQEISFEEVYDLFGIRIILDIPLEEEKLVCIQVCKLVTEFYELNPSRTRDWIEKPRENGYESLHITVMSKEGKWVEVQIRTKRMDEIAEKGQAAHWRYKGISSKEEAEEERWLLDFRNLLEEKHPQSLDYCLSENLKENL